MNQYYILTSAKKKKILVTQNYNECFEFIVKNVGTKIRTINYSAKPCILNRNIFFRDYFKNTNSYENLFILIDKMVKGDNNINDVITSLNFQEEYKAYKIVTQNSL